MSPLTFERREERRSKSSAATAALINTCLLFVLFCALPVATYCRGSRQEQPRDPLGSLTGVGEVYLNDNLAPGESTIFSGDRIRTGESGAASFVMSGKGTLKIAPSSQVLFSGNYQFTAELETGTIALNTISGPNGLSLRIGNYVVVPYSRTQSTTIQVTRAPNGAVIVACVSGTAGVLTLEGKVGQYLQTGQSTVISENSSSLLEEKPGPGGHSGWWLLGGLAGAGAVAAIAFLAHGSSGQSISPSAP
jgi:hypothetical protein